MLVEQAIFASARSGRAEGYHLIEHSPGLSESDARELSQWGPTHDSLASAEPQAASYNFFPLESGAYCVSKTSAAGAEYSGRGGAQVQTWCLVVPVQVLSRLANNPFAVWRAAAGGELPARDPAAPLEPGARLAALRLVGSAPAVDHMLLAQLTIAPGPEAMAALVEQVLSSRRLVVVTPCGEQVLAGLISCLPLDRRPGVSFSTGLKLSPRRPFRISAATADGGELRRQARSLGAEVVVLDQIGCAQAGQDSWSETVRCALRDCRFSQLSAEIVRRGTPVPIAAPAAGLPSESEMAEIGWQDSAGRAAPPAPGRQAAHVATAALQDWDAAATAPVRSSSVAAVPARRPFTHHRASGGRDCPRASLDLVEQLDDLVFDAIAGNSAALNRLTQLWPQAVSTLEPAVLAEAREQYLRRAVDVWNNTGAAADKTAEQSVAALDVLCLLFPEADFPPDRGANHAPE